MRRARPASTCARTYSAPVRVLPKPRPASSSQTRQSPGGGICPLWRGQNSHRYRSFRAFSFGKDWSSSSTSSSGSEASKLACKELAGILAVIVGLLVLVRSAFELLQHPEPAEQQGECWRLIVALHAIDLAVFGRGDDLGNGGRFGFVQRARGGCRPVFLVPTYHGGGGDGRQRPHVPRHAVQPGGETGGARPHLPH